MKWLTSCFAAVVVLAACGVAEAQVWTVRYAAPTTVYFGAPPVATTVVERPVAQTVFNAPPVQMVQRVAAPVAVQPVVTTRRRPILGGTVTRVRYRPVPVMVAAPATTVVQYPAF